MDTVSGGPYTNWRIANHIACQIIPAESTRFGMPGDRENVVKLNTDYSGVCKFGSSQVDQDNFKLVQGNIRDLYKNALKYYELIAIPFVTYGEERVCTDKDRLQVRLASLRGNST